MVSNPGKDQDKEFLVILMSSCLFLQHVDFVPMWLINKNLSKKGVVEMHQINSRCK